MLLTNFCKKIWCISALILFSFSAFAQKAAIETTNLLNKTWYIVAMKCPNDMQLAGKEKSDKFIQYYFSLELKASNPNNKNYGTYVRTSTDMDTNPRQEGKYSIKTEESGLLTLTLTNSKNQSTEYTFQAPNENHLTLYRLSDSKEEKCRVYYAIAP